ncbi:MAG: sensor histidine kinase [Gilvibacter sp.]
MTAVGCNSKNSESSQSTDAIQDSVQIILDEVRNEDLSDDVKYSKLLRAHRLVEDVEEDSVQSRFLGVISTQSFRIDQYNLTRKASIDLQALSVANNDSLGIAKSHYYLGNYYDALDQIDSAVNNFYYAERFFALVGDKFNAGRSVLSLAIIQKNQKDYAGGEASSIKALQYFSSLDEPRYMGSAYTNLGIIAKDTERYDLAIDYQMRALDYRKIHGQYSLEVATLNNLGNIYNSKEEYKTAISYFDQGLAYDSLYLKRPVTYAKLLDNKAFALYKDGQREGFPEAFLVPLRLRDSLKDKLGAASSYLHMSEYYFDLDSIDRSLEYANRALQSSRDVSYQEGEQLALAMLSKSSTPEEGLAYTNQIIRINDSLQRAERLFQDRFARLRFETDILESERNKVAQTNKQLVVVMLSLIAFGLMGYILIQRRVNQRELKFREMQQKANEEIYSLMLSQKRQLEEGKQIEKQRISEELHDGVLSKLFGTRLSLDSLNAKVDDKSVGIRTSYLDELKNIEKEIRQISHDLNASTFASDVLYVDVIDKLLHDQCELQNIDFELVNDKSIAWDQMSNNKKVHVYRIIQEALTNIMKHAKAKKVLVKFTHEDEKIQLEIRDDGVGMNKAKSKRGIGIKNITSRVRQIHGNLDIDSEPGKGTKISVAFAM